MPANPDGVRVPNRKRGLRDFNVETQTPPWKQVAVQVVICYIELRCPKCQQRSYVPNRSRPLNRTGSEREYAVCLYCGLKLTKGKVVRMPKSLRDRFMFWRKPHGSKAGMSLEAKVD